jgi:hypothetical protein
VAAAKIGLRSEHAITSSLGGYSLGYEKNFSDISAVLNIAVRISGIPKGESMRDSRLKHAFEGEIENLIGPAPYVCGGTVGNRN